MATKKSPAKKKSSEKSSGKSRQARSQTKKAPGKPKPARSSGKPTGAQTKQPARGKSGSTKATKQPGIPAFEIDVRLEDVSPPIWRRLVVPADAELMDLHLALQLAFNWENEHLHQFRIGGKTYDPGSEGGLSGDGVYDGTTLEEVLEPGTRFAYEYDFGDGWVHLLEVKERITVRAGEPRFQCLDGARKGPVENCGGPMGYAMLLESYDDPASEMHEEAVESLGEDIDPESFDRAQTNTALAALDRRINAESMPPPPPNEDADADAEPEDGPLVLLFEAGEGPEMELLELPDVIVKADAPMLERLAVFFAAAAELAREKGPEAPDLYFSDFNARASLEMEGTEPDPELPDIIVTQDA